MLCIKCKANTATFFYTQNINGKESSVALCPSCAENSGLGAGAVAPLFGSFFGNSARSVKSTQTVSKKCSLCALTFNDILSMGKVGCPECYNTFKEELKNTIRSIHGGAKHTGLTPKGQNLPVNEEINLSKEDKLRNELNEAIRTENYEQAAALRDKIKALKGEN